MPDDKVAAETAVAKDANPPAKFFLIIVNDSSEDAPKVVTCDSPEAFTASVNEHVLGAKSTMHAFGFVGERIKISLPSPVCTVEIGGAQQQVGLEGHQFDESGRITPLRKGPE